MKKQIRQGRFVVLNKGGKATFAMKADKNMIIEAPNDVEVVERTTLTLAQKAVERTKSKVVLPDKAKGN